MGGGEKAGCGVRHALTTLAVAVALTAVAVGQDLPSPDTRAVLEALLKRSRELEDVRFCVPQALWKQYLREELGAPADCRLAEARLPG